MLVITYQSKGNFIFYKWEDWYNEYRTIERLSIPWGHDSNRLICEI